MAKETGDALLAGGSWLGSFESKARFHTREGVVGAPIRCEFRLVAGTGKRRLSASFRHLSIVSPGAKAGGGRSGILSVRGISGKGHLAGGPRGRWQLEVPFTAEVLYEAVVEELGFEQVDFDERRTPPETFNGRLEAVLDLKPGTRGRGAVSLGKGRIELSYSEGGLGWIRALDIPIRGVDLSAIPTGEANIGEGNVCPTGHSMNRRRLRVQPVGFRSSASDASPTGTSAAAQFAAANAIWGKCCVQFDVQPIQILTNATLKTSSDRGAIAASFTDADPNTIEVFFGANNFTDAGGGEAFNGGSAIAKTVITDNNAGNPNLLAHELGHVLGGRHPGVTAVPPRWEGDAGTILAPSGSAAVPNLTANTHHNCVSVSNPALQTTTTTCCLSHDTTDHFIRDFPEDGGAEPASPPPGRNFYSMSNVWNRRSNAAGGTNPDGTPQHEHPVRLNTDGTPFQNRLFARVEAIRSLPPRDMQVKFFVKHPGSGGGSANLNLLGTVAVPNALSPGSPQVVSLPWTVPSGTPVHSCVFAVVRSPSEPDLDITAMGWAAVEALVREDNDWAQRNLDISETPDGNVSGGEPNTIWSAPILIVYPREGRKQGRLPLRLAIDATGAEGLERLTLEVAGLEEHELKPGGSGRLRVSKPLAPGRSYVVVLRAVIPGNAPADREHVVSLDPTLGKVPLQGYGFNLRTATPGAMVAQTLDIATAAFMDYVELRGSKPAATLFAIARELLASQPHAPEDVAAAVADAAGAMKDLESEVAASPGRADVAFGEATARFLDSLGSGSPAAVLASYRDCAARLQLVTLTA